MRPTATAASPTTSAPTSPIRTTVVPMPMSHDHETAHKTRAAIPRLRDDLRAMDESTMSNWHGRVSSLAFGSPLGPDDQSDGRRRTADTGYRRSRDRL